MESSARGVRVFGRFGVCFARSMWSARDSQPRLRKTASRRSTMWHATVTMVVAILCLGNLARAAERSLFDPSNRFLDGSVKMDGAKVKPSTFLIDSFEDAEAMKQDWLCTSTVETSN